MPNYPELDIKDTLHVEITFFDEAGAKANPATVTFQVKKPDGTLITPPITVNTTGVGEYNADHFIDDDAGIWSWRFEGVGGDAAAAEERTFTVKPSAFY